MLEIFKLEICKPAKLLRENMLIIFLKVAMRFSEEKNFSNNSQVLKSHISELLLCSDV